MEERDIYTIGEASAVTGLSTYTLRYYDSINLLSPKRTNPQNNYRYYCKEDIITLLIISRLRGMGADLNSIKTIVEKRDLQTVYHGLLSCFSRLQAEISERQAILESNQEWLSRLESAISLQQSANFHEFVLQNARIEEIPEYSLYTETRLMHNYNINDASVNFWSEIYKNCKNAGLKIIGSGITTFHTQILGQFIMQDCLMKIGLKVENKPGCDKIKTFGGFKAATAIHIGPYSEMINTYLALLQWLNRNGYTVHGPISDEAIMSPIDILDPKDHIIKVIMPVTQTEPPRSTASR